MVYTKDMTIREILFRDSKNIDIFHKYGLKCLSCLGSEIETLEEMARANEIDLDKIIQELNEI